jgi:hypothetical protein
MPKPFTAKDAKDAKEPKLKLTNGNWKLGTSENFKVNRLRPDPSTVNSKTSFAPFASFAVKDLFSVV